MRILITAVLVLIAGMTNASAQQAEVAGLNLVLPPGAVLEKTRAPATPASHMVVLGSLKTVNHELEAERAEFVLGLKSSQTFYLPQSRRTRDVIEAVSAQLEPAGELLFRCKGRDCGNSSAWANQIFGLSVLYGPEQYQYYQVYRLKDPGGYLMVYVAERATHKIYLHFEYIEG